MFDFSFNFFSDLMIALYWIPAAIVLLHFLAGITKDITEDIKRRDGSEYYYPRVTVGEIFSGFCVSFCPVLNTLTVIFHVMPDLCSGMFTRIRAIMNKPIIPAKK